jgi:hypothetical protein
MKNTFYILIFIICFSCNHNSEKFVTENNILKKTGLYKIEYYKSKKGKAFEIESQPIFKIENERDIKNVLNEIQNAENPEMWKGAGWNAIKLYFGDSIVTLKTDNNKIGLRNSGEFYSLPTENFISKRINNKK